MSMTDIAKTNRSRFGLGDEARDDEQVPVPTARALRRELFSDELIDHLLARVDEDGLALTGKGGLLPEMLKAVLERGMDAELASCLGYERGDRAGHGSGATPVTAPPRRRSAPRSAICGWISRRTATPPSPRRWCPRGRGGSGAWRT